MSLTYSFAHYRLLPDRRALLCGDSPVKLGSRAFDALLALIERRDRVVGQRELLEVVWPRLVVEVNNLQVQVASLRKLLGHPAIATVPGRGYRFTLPVIVSGDAQDVSVADPINGAATPGVPGPQSTLPSWLPALYGREQDLPPLIELLARHPLVTLTGSGGVGKTRLAQAAAAARVDDYPDGVWWVDLSPVSDVRRVPDAMALALGRPLRGSQDPTDALAAALSDRAPLVVLDNAEHLLEGVVALVTRFRRDAPRVRWLITSQEVLHMLDEQVFRVEPLSLPADAAGQGSSGAMQLFVARAQAVDRHFVLTDNNRPLVASICRRLDGIALAIELAAARVPLLGLRGLHDRLDHRLSVLTAGDRGAARRQHTLRAAVEWSHQLLSAGEQMVLRRLGVFAGGFSLEAAQDVADDEQGIDRWDVIEHLGALVDKSLVVAEGEEAPRYRMLETTRLFALERLIECGEAALARTRHRQHYLALAEEARQCMVVGNPRGLQQLDGERHNLFLALAWTHEDPTLEHGLKLAAAMRYYWTSRGLLARGLQCMLDALARPGAEGPSVTRCIVQATAAQFHSWMGQHDDALQQVRAAEEAARGLGDAGCLCLVLSASGFIQIARGDTTAARLPAHEALAMGRVLGDSHELGNALALMAAVHNGDGESAQALELLEQGVALRRRTNQPWSEALGHLNLAQMAINEGRTDGAGAHLWRVQSLLPRVDSQHIGVHLLGMSAAWAAARGDHRAAVLLDAACVHQYARVGMEDRLEPQQLERFERSRQALDTSTREGLQATGSALAYDESMLEVRRFLARSVDAADQRDQGA